MNTNTDRIHTQYSRPGHTGAVLARAAGAAFALMASIMTMEARADDWAFSISPYFWAAGIEGKTATLPGLPAADVDMSFGDIFDDLEPSGMLLFTASRDRLQLAADLQYVETQADSRSLQPLFDRERLRSTSLIFSALASYLVHDDGRTRVRLGGGLRLWSVDTDLELSSGLLRGRRITNDETWVDPIVGASGDADLGAKVFARGWAYVGGFGIGSDVTADLYLGLGYRFTDTISASLGYRWVKVDYEEDDFLYDVRQAGIATGVTFAF
ncbi:hypothetical protein [Imhoffiella purpurea]|uniref:Outer membrane protein beta-barrel domain-containing protein n=1 Tax=Imhoffiella purpurea TaxID=1249627 RepID=W9UZG6_9GAMM|nr:hypothetical protein [Imhoffiella purpurea]EXJ12633.1 hypothetical protein D779_4051 [Imhoffiella purpurea]